MLIAPYFSKKALKEEIGKPLRFVETSAFGEEYKPNGSFAVCNRPNSPGGARRDPADPTGRAPREFFAKVTMRAGLIVSVE